MIRHIVFWKLKENAEGNSKGKNALLMKEKLESLNGKIEGLLSAQVNRNYNPSGYDVCLVSTFTSKQALDFYQSHPLHVAVKSFVGSVTEDRAVTDCEI